MPPLEVPLTIGGGVSSDGSVGIPAHSEGGSYQALRYR